MTTQAPDSGTPTFIPQDEARRRLGASLDDLEAARDAVAQAAANPADTAAAVIQNAAQAADVYGISPATLEAWRDSLEFMFSRIDRHRQEVVDKVEAAFEDKERTSWEVVVKALMGRRAKVGTPLVRAMRAAAIQRADTKGTIATLGQVTKMASSPQILAEATVHLLDRLVQQGQPLTKTSLRDLIGVGALGTGQVTGNHTGRYPDAVGVSLEDVEFMAEQRKNLTYGNGVAGPHLVLACPASERQSFLIDSWPARAVNGTSVPLPDVEVPDKCQITGFWEITDVNADLLVEQHGILLEVTGGFVMSAWRVVSLAGKIDYRNRKMFVVRRLEGDEEKEWLGYVPRMATTMLVYRPQDAPTTLK